jgi:hypothetical protein
MSAVSFSSALHAFISKVRIRAYIESIKEEFINLFYGPFRFVTNKFITLMKGDFQLT